MIMPVSHKFLNALVLTFTVIFLLNISILAGDDWKPIDPAHLNMKASVVEKDADAEALFWEIKVADEFDSSGSANTVLRHYIRLKIFTERGKEQQSTVDIIFSKRGNISEIQGRTIKPNGEILELKKDAVFERTVVKYGKRQVKVKSFAMPGVEPGSIIEYRYRESRPTSYYTRLEFQQEFPVHFVKYYIKPLESADYKLRGMAFHITPSPMVKEGNFQTLSVSNVPAFKEEPKMIPEDEVRAWYLLFYSQDVQNDPQKYWDKQGKKSFGEYKSAIKVNDEVKKAATEAMSSASTTDQKLERLLIFCRTKIKDIEDPLNTYSDEDRKKLKENKSSADTLKNGYGTKKDIDLLFAALASAAGFEPHVVRSVDRSDTFFDKNFPDDVFLGDVVIALKIDSNWKYFTPSAKYVPYGMIRWENEGIEALLTDQKEPSFITLPLSAADKTLEQTIGKFKLSEDGTIEGDAQIILTGHHSALMKKANESASEQKREEALKDLIKNHLGAAELTNIKIENVTDLAKPFIYTFHIKVPNYATRTGKRLFVQPAFFQFGEAAVFPNSQRKYPIYFKYPSTEISHVEIELPEGFALDNAEAPGSFNASDIVKYTVKLSTTKNLKTLIYDRTLAIQGMIFPVSSYTALKTVFDTLHKEDNHQVTFKFATASAAK
jgi:hypothetical protein